MGIPSRNQQYDARDMQNICTRDADKPTINNYNYCLVTNPDIQTL